MKIREYVTVEEVKQVCEELGLRDWTALSNNQVTIEEARIILTALDVKDMEVREEDFLQGLKVELEHGRIFPDANVTNNHPILTGKIVLAHFKEMLDYYMRLEVVELEGDLLKAIIRKAPEKVKAVNIKLVEARRILSESEKEQLESSG